MQLKETFEKVKRASKSLALLSDEQRNEILLAVADAIVQNKVRILEANAQDLAKMSKDKIVTAITSIAEAEAEEAANG